MADRREVFTMAAGALVGVPLGTLLLSGGDPLTLRWIISIVVVVLLSFLVSGWRYSGRPKTPLTLFTGLVAGLFSGAAQLGGPPIVAYYLAAPLKGAFVRANVILYFAISTVISATSYFWWPVHCRRLCFSCWPCRFTGRVFMAVHGCTGLPTRRRSGASATA